MALAPGTRLGPYSIAEAIGSGGMGEVYRATDANLKRDVAIKVLPNSFAGDADRLARFQREAEVLASLNHPNVAHVYGLERGESITALAMELVAGQTLAERIAQGPIAVDEALGIARQIADALEAAHARGIVHRDLKPANIKLTPDGVVKVLDFGIAKALDTRTISGPQAPSLTTPAMTEAGIVLGTAQYMSPEQARGKAVDQRADIWAFGCVLYEMITGQPAFSGEDVTVVLARVLERAADLSALPAAVSEAVQQTIKLCLQKDPRKRIADIRDVRLALEGAFETHSSLPLAAAPNPSSAARLGWIIAAVALLSAVALSIPALRHFNEAPSSSFAPVARLQMTLPDGIALYTLPGQAIGVSPDGSQIAFIGVEGSVRRVYLRQVDEFEAIPIRGTETASECCAFSPDGRALSYSSANGSVFQVTLADGLVSPIATANSSYFGHTWASDDTLVYVRSADLWSATTNGGQPRYIIDQSAADVPEDIRWPSALPDGDAILFASADSGSDDWKIESVSLTTGERHIVLERGTYPLYVPDGKLLFYRDSELLVAPFDVATQQTTGPAVRMIDGISVGGSGVPIAAVSKSGTLLWVPVTGASQLVWVSRQGAELAVTDTPRMYQNPRLDPNGRWVLVQTEDLWLHDLARSTFTRIDAQTLPGAYPLVTPDGQRIIFRATDGLALLAIDGSGQSSIIDGTTINDFPASISADGERLLFVRLSPDTSGDIYETSITGESDLRSIVATPSYDGSARVSPNDQWLAFASDDSGQLEVYLRPRDGRNRRWQISTQGGTQPIWNPNGREIFYRNGNQMLSVTVAFEGDEPRLSEPELLFEQPYSFGSGITIPNYDISADGERFMMVKDDTSIRQINIVLNWVSELESSSATN